jgi:glycosyltransferase involved in cell wall biosynthesis
MTVIGDAVVSIDADLQDDPAVIEEMVDRFREGCEVVYGVRRKRDTDTWFKRQSALWYYQTLHLLGVDIIPNHADFRLLGRRAIEGLRGYSEANLFLRGIVPLIGYRTMSVYYDRSARLAGESKYPLRRMLAFAWDGITSFSVVPLRMVAFLGAVVFLGSLGLSVWTFIATLTPGRVVPGWASTVLPLYLLGGLHLLSIGIIGEYIGKIYQEVKRRPRFAVEGTVRSGESTPHVPQS